jgi:hypothetical protein
MKIVSLISALILPITIYARDYMFDALESTNFGEGGYGSGGFGLGNLISWIVGAICLFAFCAVVYESIKKNSLEIREFFEDFVFATIKDIAKFFILSHVFCILIFVFVPIEYIPDIFILFVEGVLEFYETLIKGEKDY